MVIVYALAGIWAGTVVRLLYSGARQIRQDLRSKPTPWFGLPWGMPGGRQ